MGTNYYCDVLGKETHIGKASAGWVFNMRVYPDHGISDLQDWAKLWQSPYANNIRDEYDNPVSFIEMLMVVLSRTGKRQEKSENRCKGYRLLPHEGYPYDRVNEEFS